MEIMVESGRNNNTKWHKWIGQRITMTYLYGFPEKYQTLIDKLKNENQNVFNRCSLCSISLFSMKSQQVQAPDDGDGTYACVAVQQEGGIRKIIMCSDGKITETAVNDFSKDKLWIKARVTDKDFTVRF